MCLRNDWPSIQFESEKLYIPHGYTLTELNKLKFLKTYKISGRN